MKFEEREKMNEIQTFDFDGSGIRTLTKTTKVTGKGQVWLTNEFMGERA